MRLRSERGSAERNRLLNGRKRSEKREILVSFSGSLQYDIVCREGLKGSRTLASNDQIYTACLFVCVGRMCDRVRASVFKVGAGKRERKREGGGGGRQKDRESEHGTDVIINNIQTRKQIRHSPQTTESRNAIIKCQFGIYKHLPTSYKGMYL